MDRVRVCLGHSDSTVLQHRDSHAEYCDQSDTTQSTGQDGVLHARDSCKAGHGTPPCFGVVVMLRWRILLPESHDFEHVDHADHEDTTQSSGHGC